MLFLEEERVICAYPFHGILGEKIDCELCFYLYEVGAISKGLVCSIPLSGLGEGAILCHEDIYLQRCDLLLQEFSRSRLQHNPVLLITKSQKIKQTISSLEQIATQIYQRKSSDGVSHTLSKVVLEKHIELESPLCVADGHHRFSALLQYYRNNQGLTKQPRIMAAIFNADQVITRTKGVVVEGISENTSQWMGKLRAFFHVQSVEVPLTPASSHDFSMLHKESWYQLSLKPIFAEKRECRDCLGIEILKKFILQQTLNMGGYANSPNVKVNFEKCNIAALMQKTRKEKTVGFIAAADESELVIDIARHGRILEANSTYFEPKLLDRMIGLKL